MALLGGVFLQTLRTFRVCWLGGRFGGGKTALAVRLAYEFIHRGWAEHMICNFPCVLATDLARLPELRDTVIVLDEAGVWMDTGYFNEVVAFLRKRNLTVIMPSVLPPPTRAQALSVQRFFNGHTIGFNVWGYSMLLQHMRVKERYNLWWFNPREVYGLWDTAHVATDDGGILGIVRDAFYGENKNHSAVAAGSGGESLAGLRWIAEDLNQAAQNLETVSLDVKRSGRRRR